MEGIFGLAAFGFWMFIAAVSLGGIWDGIRKREAEHETVRRIAQGEADVTALAAYHYDEENAWPRDAMRMLFVSNHDKNAWEGTQFEAFGDALENAERTGIEQQHVLRKQCEAHERAADQEASKIEDAP